MTERIPTYDHLLRARPEGAMLELILAQARQGRLSDRALLQKTRGEGVAMAELLRQIEQAQREFDEHKTILNPVDDHIQYALLAGRSGGQTLQGGIATGEDLTLRGNSFGLDGSIFLGSSSLFEFDEATGQLKLPTQGIFGGLEIGGDTLIFRLAADVLATNDQFNIGGGVLTDTVGEFTGNAGVLIDSVLLKDGLVDGIDVAILEGRVTDLETVTEFMDFVFSNGANGVVGGHGVTVLNSTQKAAWSWTVPDDFVSLVEVVLFMIPDETETLQVDLTISSNAPGEDFNFNQIVTANKQQSVTISDITEMSLTSITPTLAAGDLMGVLCESDTSDIRLVGIRVTYVRT